MLYKLTTAKDPEREIIKPGTDAHPVIRRTSFTRSVLEVAVWGSAVKMLQRLFQQKLDLQMDTGSQPLAVNNGVVQEQPMMQRLG